MTGTWWTGNPFDSVSLILSGTGTGSVGVRNVDTSFSPQREKPETVNPFDTVYLGYH